jgi:hypothetical protein
MGGGETQSKEGLPPDWGEGLPQQPAPEAGHFSEEGTWS